MLACQAELLSYGEGIDQAALKGKAGNSQRGTLLLRLVTMYVSDFQEAIQGTSRVFNPQPQMQPGTDQDHNAPPALVGGARLSHIFHDLYAASVNEMDAAGGLSLVKVRTAIRNSSVPHLP